MPRRAGREQAGASLSSPARTISSEILERTKRPSFRSDGWLTVACPPPLLHVAATAKIFGTAMHGSGWCGGCRSFGSSTQSCLPAHWCDQPRANASSEQLPGVYFPQPAATSTAPKSANVMVSVAEASSQRSSTVPIPYLKACLRQRGWACEGVGLGSYAAALTADALPVSRRRKRARPPRRSRC